MRVTSVAYEATFNLGNFENEKIRVEAQVDERERTDEAIEELREIVQYNCLHSKQTREARERREQP